MIKRIVKRRKVKYTRVKYTGQERDYILKMLFLARSQNALALTDSQHKEIIKRAKKDYAAACKAVGGKK